MGLGPPVCETCQVICKYSRDLFDYGRGGHYCPICGNTSPKDHAGLSDSQWAQLEANYKFLKFTLKK